MAKIAIELETKLLYSQGIWKYKPNNKTHNPIKFSFES